MGGKMMKVIRNKEGKVINIGEWDYMKEHIEDPETGEITIAEHNPLPDGATSADEEIVELPDGGLAAANP
uniref:Uncharacterized protein n=1 Tax=Klebsiella phage vB_KpnM_Iguana_ER37 TaxID=3076781 RepID=A0AB38Z412_9CAUD